MECACQHLCACLSRCCIQGDVDGLQVMLREIRRVLSCLFQTQTIKMIHFVSVEYMLISPDLHVIKVLIMMFKK